MRVNERRNPPPNFVAILERHGQQPSYRGRPVTRRVSGETFRLLSRHEIIHACKQTICKGDLRFAITAFVRPNRSTLLARCCHCIDARFASAVLAVYGTANRVPAAQGVSEEGAAQVRVTLKNSATISS